MEKRSAEKPKINPQQELFCQEYIVDYNGTQAAIRAGYSEKTAKAHASRLLTNVDILARVHAIQTERLKKLAVTQEAVILKILEIYDRCMQAAPVTEWDYSEHKYVETGEYTFDSKGALRAMELLGKHLAMFTNKVEHSGSVSAENPVLESILTQLNGRKNENEI